MKKISIGILATVAAVLASVVTANETITIQFQATSGGFDLSRYVSQYVNVQGTNTMTYSVINVTSATNQLAVGADVTIAGYAYARNLGTSTVYMAISGSTTPFLQFETNNVGLFPLAATNLQVWTSSGRGGIFEFWINNK